MEVNADTAAVGALRQLLSVESATWTGRLRRGLQIEKSQGTRSWGVRSPIPTTLGTRFKVVPNITHCLLVRLDSLTPHYTFGRQAGSLSKRLMCCRSNLIGQAYLITYTGCQDWSHCRLRSTHFRLTSKVLFMNV